MVEKSQASRKLVIIGASAGGLTPLIQVIKNLKIDSNTSVIIAMHLSPRHKSFLPDIIAKSTKHSVSLAQNLESIKTKHIYVLPPDRHAQIEDWHYKLIKDDTAPQPNINILMESVAKLDSVIAIGVLLSGNGEDGTKGLLSIKIHGGLTFVQDPNTADYDAMPNAAIGADAADFVLAADEIGKAISRIFKNNQFPNATSTPLGDGSEQGVSAILDYLYAERQIDLHNYKATSLRRRIYRRVALGGFSGISQYLEKLKQDPSELESLINDIFISVTAFMRDQSVWTYLRTLVSQYIQSHPGKILRVWCVGCSSGEEAYSWAIILEEIRGTLKNEFDYMIFATDISERSIAVARRGVYDISTIEALSESTVEQYFTQNQYGYAVTRRLRDKVVFSIHNLLLDPPFSNIDFISCRNVLIYFNQKLQKRALANFGYSLIQDGILVLGSSESPGQNTKFFADFDKDKKIFSRTAAVSSQQLVHHSIRKTQISTPRTQSSQKQETLLLNLVQKKIAEYSGYSALLIDDKDDILFIYGTSTPAINVKPGRFSQSIFDYLDNEYRAPLRALILKSRRIKKPISHIEKFEKNGLILSAVLPVEEPENWTVIILAKKTLDSSIDSLTLHESNLDSKLVHELEAELNSTRISLQTVVEELEQTNDALQSSNEELQSSNEELQATNEELQTTNEELQSSNEELRTLNEELRIKNTELDLVSSHLQSVEENLETPYILLSNSLQVIRFSKTIELFSTTETLELDQTLDNIPWLKPELPLQKSLKSACLLVLNDRMTRTLSGYRINDKRYDIAVKHYSDILNRFNEVMLIFTDVTHRFNVMQKTLGDYKKRDNILNLLETGIIFTDTNGNVMYVNPESSRYLPAKDHSYLGEHIDKLFHVYLDPESKYPESGIFQKMTDKLFGSPITAKQPLTIKSPVGYLTIQLNVTASKTEQDVDGWLFEIRDISNEAELSRYIEHNVTHDALTGLHNRRALEDSLVNLNHFVAINESLVYALIDIDHFKPINDIAGHLYGDEALQMIGELIITHIRPVDMLARIGGDEFALALPKIERTDANKLLKEIVKSIDALELETSEGVFNVSASISWCYLTADSEVTLSELYSNADEAMYLAKRSGGNTLQEFQIQGIQSAQSISALTFEKIKFAFKHGLSHFVFQPIIDLKNKKTRYFEMLIRIRDNDSEMKPYEFMPVVERYNYTRKFDRHVFRQALEVIQEIQQRTTEKLHFAINLSSAAIENRDVFDILADFPRILGSSHIKLTLEITETAAIRDLLRAKRFIERARGLGIQVALDDFGVGYNGYHYLRELNVDTVKIDGSFINGIVESEVDKIFVNSVIELSKVLNFQTVAEFVDTQEKLNIVQDLGFRFSQGYLHSEPLDKESFFQYIGQ